MCGVVKCLLLRARSKDGVVYTTIRLNPRGCMGRKYLGLDLTCFVLFLVGCVRVVMLFCDSIKCDIVIVADEKQTKMRGSRSRVMLC